MRLEYDRWPVWSYTDMVPTHMNRDVPSSPRSRAARSTQIASHVGAACTQKIVTEHPF